MKLQRKRRKCIVFALCVQLVFPVALFGSWPEWEAFKQITTSMESFIEYTLRLFSSQNFSLSLLQHFSDLVILHLPDYEDGIECSETSVYKIQTPGNYPEESIQQAEILTRRTFLY